jgi:hypothetical protein
MGDNRDRLPVGGRPQAERSVDLPTQFLASNQVQHCAGIEDVRLAHRATTDCGERDLVGQILRLWSEGESFRLVMKRQVKHLMPSLPSICRLHRLGRRFDSLCFQCTVYSRPELRGGSCARRKTFAVNEHLRRRIKSERPAKLER